MKRIILSAVVAASTVLVMQVNAQILLLDFGPTTVTNVNPSFDATVSPAHSAGLSTSVATWNKVGIADIGSGLLYGDGSAATGLTLDLGVGDNTVNVNFATNPDNGTSVTGTAFSTGVYSGTRVARDGIFQNTSGTSLGIQIGGLAAGDYVIYLTGRNTNTSSTTTTQRFYGAVGTSSGTFDFSGVTNFADIANNTAPASNASFVAGVQYNTVSVTLGLGQSLFLGIDATGSDARTFLNSIEIVAVPEPTSVVMILGGLGPMVALRRRRS